jgi:hypothetical protein
MAKTPKSESHASENFGDETSPKQMQSPLSFQLNGDGTPEFPCKLLLDHEEEAYLPRNTVGWAGVGKNGDKEA